MMRLYLSIFMLLAVFSLWGQNDQLAQNYFDKGDFDKARLVYEDLVKTYPNQNQFFLRLVACHQELEQYDQSERLLRDRFNRHPQGMLLAEIGYNFQLKKNADQAKKHYEQALDVIRRNPGELYSIAPSFERHSLYEYALKAYQLGKELNPQFNVNLQIAVIHGQMGNFESMIEVLLDEAKAVPNNLPYIQTRMARYMAEDHSEQFSAVLRKSLLVRAQKDQDVMWNTFLSWFFVQQKEYAKAFVQEKAIYKRNQESLYNIMTLAQLALDERDVETATEIYTYILENSYDLDEKAKAQHALLKFKIDGASAKDYGAIDKQFQTLLDDLGRNPQTLNLQLLQAEFVTFQMQEPSRGKALVQETMKLNLSRYQLADCKMRLADIYLFEEKFNQALLVYSQVEEDLKNDVIGHEANLRAARTSYFKGDFDWALQQFGALKSANTQLIANDALEYYLLINDNKMADSTQVAMQDFAKADYLKFQNKNRQAKEKFLEILRKYQGNEIEAVTYLRLGQLDEELRNYPEAIGHYQKILDQFSDGIYTDEALYFSGCIYQEHMQDSEKAKAMFEKLIFEHQDSIFFVDARRRYRILRGDATL